MNFSAYTILYFGSFNPIHRGHLALADHALEVTQAHELWFVVSPQNPLKQKMELAPELDRLHMVEIAVKSASHAHQVRVCGIEFELSKPSGTLNTLLELDKRYPKRKFVLLIGSDNVPGFTNWIHYDQIIDHYPILVYPREGSVPLSSPIADRFCLLDKVPWFPQQATDIRRIVAEGKDCREELPPGVWDYIKTHRLYGFK